VIICIDDTGAWVGILDENYVVLFAGQHEWCLASKLSTWPSHHKATVRFARGVGPDRRLAVQ
jgi:hypothetical protein